MALSHQCRTQRCLVSRGRVTCSRTSFGEYTPNATHAALCWPESAAEHKTSRSWDVTPLFFVRWVRCLLLMFFSFTTAISKRHGGISVVNEVVWAASHAVCSSSGSTDLSTGYQGFSSLAPYLHASSEGCKSSCQKDESLSSEVFTS